MDFPPESVELLSLDNRIEMVKYTYCCIILLSISLKKNFLGRNGFCFIASICQSDIFFFSLWIFIW